MADKHHIITISAIVFCFLADRLLVSCSVDYAERRAGPSIINLRDSNSAPSHIGRFKRAINAKLASSNFTLPDKEHNEAIVHWSGKKSEVSNLSFRIFTTTHLFAIAKNIDLTLPLIGQPDPCMSVNCHMYINRPNLRV